MKSRKDVIDFMNHLLAVDPKAIESLLLLRAKCNDALADHPTVQVRYDAEAGYCVGLLGILNGLFGDAENGKIAAIYDADGTLLRFEEI